MAKQMKLSPDDKQNVRIWAESGKTVPEINNILNEMGVYSTYAGLRSVMKRMKAPLHRAEQPHKVITKELEAEIKEWLDEGVVAADVYKRLVGRGVKVSRQRVYQKLELMGTTPRSLKEKKIERRGSSGYKDTGIVEFTRNHYDELEMKADLMQYSESMDNFRAQCWKRFKQKKYNTTSTRHVWDVEFEDIYFPLICPVLGVKLDYSGKEGGRSEFAPSFDRLDPTLGYVRGNVVIMSWRANRLKNDGTAEEHRALADFLDSYHETKDDSLSLNELYEYDEEDEPTPEFVAEQARRAELPKEYKKCNCCGEYKALKQYVGEGVTYSTCIPCREQASYDQKGKKKSTNDFFLGVAWGNKATADFIKEFVATSKESSPSV
jgi:hypothetical protein